MSIERHGLSAYITLSLVAFLGLAALFFPFTADDAWIVARYSRNLAVHGELVFNRGEFINALTSPLDAIMRVVWQVLAPAPMTVAKVAGALYAGGAVLIGLLLLRGTPAAQAAFVGLTAVSAPFALWAVGGLETPLLALLATAFAACLWADDGNERLLPAALLAGLAFLARHDSVLFTGPALLWAMRRLPPLRWLAVAAIAAILPLLWLGFAQRYFHDVFPTSFHVKSPTVVALTIRADALYLLDFLLESGVGLVLGATLCVAALRTKPGARLYGRAGLWLGLGAAILLYGPLVAMSHMMFSFRLLMPYLPVLALLTAEFFAKAIAGVPVPAWRRLVGGTLAALTISQAALAYTIERWSLNPPRVGEYHYVSAAQYRRDFLDLLPQAADAIAADWRKHAPAARPPRVLTFAAGLLPWRLPDAYTFETLISWRRACPADRRVLAGLADYVHLVTPWSGSLAAQLPGPPDRFEIVWQRTTVFDGAPQTWMVLRNNKPDPSALPPYIDGPCLLPAV